MADNPSSTTSKRRTTTHRLNRLTSLTVKSITKPGWHADGGGLYLEVDKGGAKRWALRLTVNGRRRDFGLGSVKKLSLPDARERAAAYRAKAHAGIDPLSAADGAPSISFKEAAENCHSTRKGGWSSGKHVDQWINTLHDYAFPFFGDKPVDTVDTPAVLEALSAIWTDKPETARRVRQRIRTVLEWARAAGHRSGDNPVDLIGDALPKQQQLVEHHEALPYDEVAAFLKSLRASNCETVTRDAFEFLILTTARTKEVRYATWDEIDLEQAFWTIPAARMKARRPHVVPLSKPALKILKARHAVLPRDSLSGALIFSDTDTGQPLSENRFLNARDTIGYRERCTPHGFRSSFRDWASEETNFPGDVAEMALAHVIKDKTEAAYRRGELLAKRRRLMEAWARYIRA